MLAMKITAGAAVLYYGVTAVGYFALAACTEASVTADTALVVTSSDAAVIEAIKSAGYSVIRYFGADIAKEVVAGGTAKYLETPATKNGTLNIGAGQRPLEGAYNIDINPAVPGVNMGNVTNLSNIATGSQSKIIMQNPYGYDVLTSEVSRALQKGGTLEITGGMSNPAFNMVYKMTEVELNSAGYSFVSKGQAVNAAQGYKTTGEEIQGTVMEIILKKN
ncbi:MAG: hypothetical protein FWG53_05300 [Clostridiales bacterium]|nr:hypothetical protein [Clostridiales bacterium]